MTEPPSAPPPPAPGEAAVQFSPDGRHYWTGQRWAPVPGRPPAATGRWVIAVVVALIAGGICGAALGSSSAKNPGRAIGLSSPAAAAETPTPPPSPSPSPSPVPITLTGQNSKVSDPIDFPAGLYKVSWSAQGRRNFIVHLEGDRTYGLVNEILPSPSSGETTFRSGGGKFIVQVQASEATWTITFLLVGA